MINHIWFKTTMTSGESSCLISFARATLTCSERGGSEKFKMKIYVSSGIRTHTTPRRGSRGRRLNDGQKFNVLQDNGIQINKTIT